MSSDVETARAISFASLSDRLLSLVPYREPLREACECLRLVSDFNTSVGVNESMPKNRASARLVNDSTGYNPYTRTVVV